MNAADLHELVELTARLAALATRLATATLDPTEHVSEVDAARIAGTSVRALRDARRAGELVMYGRQRSRTVRRGDLAVWIESRKVKPLEGVDDADMDRRVARLAKGRRAHRRLMR